MSDASRKEVPGEDDPLAEPFALRDVSERLPNESLRSELETMSAEEQEAYLRHLEELSKLYLGPGGP